MSTPAAPPVHAAPGPSTTALIEAWERGQSATPLERALLLLAAAEPQTPADELAALCIGARNARLLRLRERAFGPRLECVTACAVCAEELELVLTVPELLGAPAASDGDARTADPIWLDVGERRVRLRLPTSLDLAAVVDAGEAAPAALLERCVEGFAGAAPVLAVEFAGAAAARLAEADPLAEPELALACPACGAHWSAPLDIAAYVWAEIGAWARRILREVHLLASAYGWSESAILALSPQRRQVYLEWVGA